MDQPELCLLWACCPRGTVNTVEGLAGLTAMAGLSGELRPWLTSCQLSLKERDARVEALEGAIERARALEGFPGSNSSKWVHYELLQEALAVTEQEGET